MHLSDLYRAAVETSPDGIWVIDLGGHTIYANPEIARIHRIPEDQVASLTVFDTLDELGREQFAAHLAEAARGDLNRSDVEVQWVRSDGSLVWMLVSETVLTDERGEAYALLHRFSDYSERRSILESLRASEDALEDQVAQNTLMQAVTSAANRARTLDDVLVHARDLVLLHDDWERARAFVPVDGSLVAFHDDDGDDPVAVTELALASRSYHQRELVWDERRLVMAFPVIGGAADDDRVHAVIVMTSAPPLFRFALIESMAGRVAEQLAQVVRRQQAEEELSRARDQAMEASRQKSEFLATMSHEIRTPLNGVIGLNDLMLRGRLDADQHRIASGVQVASRALLDVLNGILDFSKIEAGRLELERVAFSVRSLLDQVAGPLAETARSKGLDLTVACDPDVPTTLTGDPTRLAQVLTNLISNAVKFTEHGRVAVTASVGADGSGSTEQVQLLLDVSDTGVGVAADRVSGLFDPFTQADTSTTRRFGGTGLGLAISREIALAMDGEITYVARVGGGSVFRARVVMEQSADEATARDGDLEHDPDRPHVASEEGRVDADQAARRVLAGRRVLLVNEVDDHVLVEQLTYWGLDVERMPSVRAAIQRLGGGDVADVDLVIASFDSAERHAVQVADRMRAQIADPQLPFLTVAGHHGADASLTTARDDVLVRPVLPSVLRAALLRMVTGETPAHGAQVIVKPAARGRILVVEDHPINQMVAEGLLGALGYTCEVAEDGEAGVEAVAAGGFDAVLMDVQMPRLDGYAAVRRIRAAEGHGPRLPIIAMTAAAIENERERCLAAGMDDYLTKPIDTMRLEACLRRWTGTSLPQEVAARLGEAGTALDHDADPTHAPDPEASPVLDTGRLEELRELDTPTASYVDRAIGNFLANSLRDIALMQEALVDGDLAQLRSVAHRLAGSALNLGATAAGETLRSLEDQIRAEDVDDLAAGLLGADLELAHAREALQAYLAHPSGAQAPVSA